ncbi:MAG: anti-sigma factor domain-containing protein, partial [Actinomycetota bacterium]
VEDLLGAYALDAVPEDERRLVEEHLAVCEACRREVMEHRETVALLSGGAAAPVGVWDRISAELEPEPPVSLEAQRAPRKIGRWATGMAAAAAALAIVALGMKVVEQDRRIDRLAATSEDRALALAAEAALRDPAARRVTLRSAEGEASVEAVVLPDGTGYLYRNDLRPLPPGRTYQLWALGEADPISAGVLGPEPSVVAFSVDPAVTGLAITRELAGGVVAPTSDPLVAGQLQSA